MPTLASTLVRRGGGRVRFAQLGGAFLAAHFHGLSADADLDGVVVQRVVAGGAGLFAHARAHVRDSSDAPIGQRHWTARGTTALSKTLAMQRRLPELAGRAPVRLLERRAEMAVAGEAQVQAERGEVVVFAQQVQRARLFP